MDTTCQTFEAVDSTSVVDRARAMRDGGWRFSQLCGTVIDGGVEVMYTFERDIEMVNLLAECRNGSAISSITEVFPAAFVFENELQDLFGLTVEGISIDYGGSMYRLAVPSPMNPDAAAAPEEEGGPDGN